MEGAASECGSEDRSGACAMTMIGVAGIDSNAEPHHERLARLAMLARKALTLWDLPERPSVELVNLSENATYKVEAPDGRLWALRLHREGYHSENAIRSELAWLMALRRDGIVETPVPVLGRDGGLIQQAHHPGMPRPRNAVLFEWEAGAEPGIGEDLRKPFEALGEVTARMHSHARGWTSPPFFERFTWDVETALGEWPHWGRWQDGMAVDPGRCDLFGRTVELIRQRLAAHGKGADRFGLAHCDLRLANLLIDGSAVKVIDFDDCGFSWFMYDAATPVSFFEHREDVPELIQHWCEGYARAGRLDQADVDEIPTFVMFRRLLLVAWIGSHAETDLAQSMGVRYTEETVRLCQDYLRRFG